MTTIRIEDYLNETAPEAYVSCDPGDEARLREAALYCCFTAVELAGEQFLSPGDIRDLLVRHYGFRPVTTESCDVELDVSMEQKLYKIMGRPTVALSAFRDRHAASHPTVRPDIDLRFSAAVGRG
ncbi:hypothetical protein HFO56_33750 [Rhizobium laguerreae]|uniref:hypothetical protein n=1 Tax=Rhizobium laguerreae TaxID=1076926 RepID=UPI001C903DC6|nr:hypothetical protein [Rhizobium laguerreae]MBY3157292.1 hypothetical protein [Rhizobium laguerreae]